MMLTGFLRKMVDEAQGIVITELLISMKHFFAICQQLVHFMTFQCIIMSY